MIQSRAGCLPVTALLPVPYDGNIYLLAGQGPNLYVYNEASLLIACESVFEAQPIHGIKLISSPQHHSVSDALDIVLWGGRWVCLGTLTFGRSEVSASVSKPRLFLRKKVDAGDWILKVVATSDTVSRSGDHSGTSLFTLTAHNDLIEICPKECKNNESPSPQASHIIQGPQSFLYSGDIKVVEGSHIIVASGTVFGEIIIWTCSKDSPTAQLNVVPRQRFHGHRGSIFGVSISDALGPSSDYKRLVVSCSDDRTIRLWDIGECTQPEASNSLLAIPTTTGFGNDGSSEDLQIAATWGHSSRIWNAEFKKMIDPVGKQSVYLLSRGEDATCQFWALKQDEETQSHQPPVIRNLYQDRHHHGKNIWSMAQHSDQSGVKVYTGGADGQIITRNSSSAPPKHSCISQSFKQVTESTKALKQYILLNPQECIACTDVGEIFHLTTSSKDMRLRWAKILGTDAKGPMVTCHLRNSKVILVARHNEAFAILQGCDCRLTSTTFSPAEGISWMEAAYDPSQVGDLRSCVVATRKNRAASILWVPGVASAQIEVTDLELPETFHVTATCYDPVTELLVLGSRAGALAFYLSITLGKKGSGTPFCFRHVHGEDSVTSIKVVRTGSQTTCSKQNLVHILTTGRDGYYAIHQLTWASSTNAVPQFSTLHSSSPPFGPNIEGCYFTPALSGTMPWDLVLYGFRSTSFVVWNETQQSTVLTVECGGAHRSWAYMDSASYKSCQPFNTYDQPSPEAEPERSFVWTKTGSLNWYTAKQSDHYAVQTGGHGREIKAVAFCDAMHVGNGGAPQSRSIVATGAEDTNIQLFTLEAGPPGAIAKPFFQSLSILKGHTTGIQHLRFSSSGNYLFSSASCEEFYVWKLSYDVPCVGVGVVLHDQMRKEAEDSDARIMSFDVVEVTNVANGRLDHQPKFLITMAYSTGKVKIIRYTPSRERNRGTFETLKEISYGAFCLMQAVILTPENHDATQFHRCHILSAGTNGFLNISRPNLSTSASESPRIEAHRVHQSSIVSMDIVSLGHGAWLIATGGDDNALSLTLLTASTSDGEPAGFRSLRVPKAHAAALTALKITQFSSTAENCRMKIVTVGNDQRVKVWGVQISRDLLQQSDDQRLEGFTVQRLASAWTAVADVSAIEVLGETGSQAQGITGSEHGARAHCDLMVVGVGMELLGIDLGPK